ncbi:hypothetical protein DIPPA_30205 [Diplonema papillatum]|nr:hypothetical protein DIPPA_30205 [Diplonema papillatum]KAJ9457479.1 hypothetical protein DIPPA_30205 [Diplonema papillatum]
MLCTVYDSLGDRTELTHTFDFETNRCSQEVLYTQHVVGRTGGNIYEKRETYKLGAGREVELSEALTEIVGRPVRMFLVVQLRNAKMSWGDGNKQQLDAFFGHFEVQKSERADGKERSVVLNEWFHIGPSRLYADCEGGIEGLLDASYTYYNDGECSEFNRTVTFFEADGSCRPHWGYTGSYFQVVGSALCEGDTLYASSVTTAPDISACDSSSTVLELKSAPAYTFTLSTDRGRCRQQPSGGSVLLSSFACTQREPACVWKAGYFEGSANLIATGIQAPACLDLALKSQTSNWCGIAWEQTTGASPQKRCYSVTGSCIGPYTSMGDEWTCLLRSTQRASSKKENNMVLIIFLIIVFVLCPMFGLVIVVFERSKARARLAREQQEHVVTVDSGRTDGIVMGVPVPDIRRLAHDDDEEEGCGAAPFQPDPLITTNPLRQFTSAEGPRTPAAAAPPPPPSPPPPQAADAGDRQGPRRKTAIKALHRKPVPRADAAYAETPPATAAAAADPPAHKPGGKRSPRRPLEQHPAKTMAPGKKKPEPAPPAAAAAQETDMEAAGSESGYIPSPERKASSGEDSGN